MGATILAKRMGPWEYQQTHPGRPDSDLYELKPGVVLEEGQEPRPSQVVRRCPSKHFARGSAWCKRVAAVKGTTEEEIEKRHRIKDFIRDVFLYHKYAIPGFQSSIFAAGKHADVSKAFDKAVRKASGIKPLHLSSGPLWSEARRIAAEAWDQ